MDILLSYLIFLSRGSRCLWKYFLLKYIIRRNKDASDWTLKSAEKAKQQLQRLILIRPYFLQRMKNTEFKELLPNKKELVVWTRMTERQRTMYENYLVDAGKVSVILSGAVSLPLETLTRLKKLCGHPCLVSYDAIMNHYSMIVESLRYWSTSSLN